MPIGDRRAAARSVPGDRHDAADRHDREREERGEHREVRRQPEHGLVGAGRRRLLLEEQLDAVGERLEHAARPGLHRPDPVLHVGDDLAHEPDVEHHRDEQECEHHDRLDDHDQDDREVDVAVEERVGARADGGRSSRHRTVSTRRSVTGCVRSMRSAAPGPAWFTARNATPCGVPASAWIGQLDAPPTGRRADDVAVGDTDAVAVEGVDEQPRAVGEACERRGRHDDPVRPVERRGPPRGAERRRRPARGCGRRGAGVPLEQIRGGELGLHFLGLHHFFGRRRDRLPRQRRPRRGRARRRARRRARQAAGRRRRGPGAAARRRRRRTRARRVRSRPGSPRPSRDRSRRRTATRARRRSATPASPCSPG